jgi:hypothetical protein
LVGLEHSCSIYSLVVVFDVDDGVTGEGAVGGREGGELDIVQVIRVAMDDLDLHVTHKVHG